MDRKRLELLINETKDSPNLGAYLKTHFIDADPDRAHLLLDEAEESPYPLRQWLEALQFFDQWLDNRGLSLPIENQIGYIACSAESGSAYATLTQLPVQLEEMLDTYGCDDAVTK